MIPTFFLDLSLQDPLLLAIAGVFVLSWLIQMLYFLIFFRRMSGIKNSGEVSGKTEGVSVVIAARNEFHNLSRNLELILSQDYPQFEVVVVNDASDDESWEYLRSLQQQHPNLNVLTIHSHLNFFRGKKFPLGLGIKAAKYPVLLLTDADCRPTGPDWIRTMVNNYREGTEIVLGYGSYENKKGLLDKLVRWDTVQTAMQYFSFAQAGIPYMGVGRNLSYRKKFFELNKGFLSHYHIPGGDDDLFVNQNARKTNTRLCLEPSGFTLSSPPRDFSEWIRQKRRHITTGKYYKGRDKFLLAGWPLSLFFLLASITALGLFQYNLPLAGFLLLIRSASFLAILKKNLGRLQEKKLFVFSPIFEFFFLFFYPLLALYNLFNKPGTWK